MRLITLKDCRLTYKYYQNIGLVYIVHIDRVKTAFWKKQSNAFDLLSVCQLCILYKHDAYK